MTFSLFSLRGLAIVAAFFLAGIIDSICGGGGLVTIPVMMLTGMPVHLIPGTNQCSTTLGNIVSVAKYARERIIRYEVAIPAIPFAILGAFFGSRLNMVLSERVLQYVMMGLIPVMAVLMLVKRDFGTESALRSLSRTQVFLRAALTGLVVGTYQGFYGPGAGMLFLMAFTLLLRMGLLEATGTVRLVGMCASLSATITYAVGGQVAWQLAGACMVVNILGSYLGSLLAIKNGARLIRPLMLVVLLLLAANILSSLLG